MPMALGHLHMHAEQIIARCRELATLTDVPGETTRIFLSPATRLAQARITSWMEQARLDVTIDAIGNLHGSTRNRAADTPHLLIGSHIDTVINAGAFDGLLGILIGIALAELFDSSEMPFALEIVAFSEEEGIRFRFPFLGSLSLIGEPVPATLTDAEGVTLAQSLAQFGHKPAAASLANVFAYLEFHIEQGPLLEAEQRPLAAVNAIAGQTRVRLRFRGQANHAGTTPMPLRHDALAAAAAWIVAVEACALAQPGLVATVGSIKAIPDIGNVIAEEALATLDLRHADDVVRQNALQTLIEAAHAAAAQRGASCAIEILLDQSAVAMDPLLTRKLVTAAASCGYDARPITSGAGHDAMIVARKVPSTMLFLRTPQGLSHHRDESVLLEDVEAALATALAFLHGLAPDGQFPEETNA